MDGFFAFLGEKRSKAVDVAVMDVGKPLCNSTKAKAPQAAIFFDKFHLLRDVKPWARPWTRFENRNTGD
jgi:transposase